MSSLRRLERLACQISTAATPVGAALASIPCAADPDVGGMFAKLLVAPSAKLFCFLLLSIRSRSPFLFFLSSAAFRARYAQPKPDAFQLQVCLSFSNCPALSLCSAVLGYRLLRLCWAQGISHLALVCSDMERTVRFYCDLLGLALVKTIELPDGAPYFSRPLCAATCLTTLFVPLLLLLRASTRRPALFLRHWPGQPVGLLLVPQCPQGGSWRRLG